MSFDTHFRGNCNSDALLFTLHFPPFIYVYNLANGLCPGRKKTASEYSTMHSDLMILHPPESHELWRSVSDSRAHGPSQWNVPLGVEHAVPLLDVRAIHPSNFGKSLGPNFQPMNRRRERETDYIFNYFLKILLSLYLNQRQENGKIAKKKKTAPRFRLAANF